MFVVPGDISPIEVNVVLAYLYPKWLVVVGAAPNVYPMRTAVIDELAAVSVGEPVYTIKKYTV